MADPNSLRPLLEELCRAVQAAADAAGAPVRAVVPEVYRPKARLFQQGMAARHLFVLTAGYVKLSSSLPDGRTQGLRLATPWTLLGAEALGDHVYHCTGDAATDVHVHRINHHGVLHVLDEDPAVARRVMALLKRDLCQSMALVRDLGLKSAKERLASFLLACEQTDGRIPLPRTVLAEMLGMTVETVSRTLAALRREAVLDAPPNRPIRITDRDRLAALSGDGP